jgi:hypothetical protein
MFLTNINLSCLRAGGRTPPLQVASSHTNYWSLHLFRAGGPRPYKLHHLTQIIGHRICSGRGDPGPTGCIISHKLLVIAFVPVGGTPPLRGDYLISIINIPVGYRLKKHSYSPNFIINIS